MLTKLTLILGVIALALIGILRIAGVIGYDIASDVAGRSLLIIAVITLTGGVVSFLVGKKRANEAPVPPNSGPQF